MTEFTIGNICKEVQRIRFDLENEEIASAMKRCDDLDQLLYDIEEGKYSLVVE
ncbi:hypothetical protein [Methanobrevibacter sp. V74]|uniref:hypothetical protein n=1 Tax=Methanobrevibacter sp. V74 TaxID=3064279 RepID=UPI00273649BE|nr:hypothetical protein [Methanobrevibacter sp. V74]